MRCGVGGRGLVAMLGTAVALPIAAPATGLAASFKWTAGSIGEAFAPGHTATELRDGHLLFAGGSDPYLSAGEIVCCRPARRSFDVGFPRRLAARFSQMTTPRTLHHAVLLNDGRVLVVGGDTSGTTSELWESDLGSDNWVRAGDLPAPVGAGAIAEKLGSGRVLYAGGADAPGASEPTARAALYDDLTFSWSATGSMVTVRRDAASAALADGRILVSGGKGPGGTDLASAETFDPATGTWAPVAPMTSARVGHALVTLTGGRVLAVGGTPAASAEIYDPAADQWTATPPPAQVAGASSASMPVVRALRLRDGSVVAVDAVHTARFDPTRNTWQRLPNAPFGGHRYGSLVHLPDGRVLYAYGVLPGSGGVSAGADVLGPPVQLRVLSATGNRVRYRVGEDGPTRFSVARAARHGRFARLRGRVVRSSRAGVNELALNRHWRGHRLTPGLYRLKVVKSSSTELVQSRPAFVKFRVR